MEFGYPIGELVWFAFALVATGAVAGVLAGVFGIGGGAVLVPVLYQFLEMLNVDDSIRIHVAVGTSLGIIVPTSLRSFRSHMKRGAVDMDLLKSFIIPVPLGVIIGSLVAAYISGAGLKAIFACIALAVAIKMLFGRASWRLGDDLPGQPGLSIVGVVMGFFSVLMGIGGGVMNNTFMTLFNRPIHQAVATSSGVGVLISIPGMLGFIWAGWGAEGLPPLSLGFVNILAVLLVIPVTLLVAPLGVHVAHALSKRTLEMSFGIFLVIVAARFFYSLI